MKEFACSLLLLTGLFSCAKKPVPAAVPPVAYDVLIANVNVVDVVAEKVMVRQYVALKDQCIAFVGTTEPPANTSGRHIDGTGKYLIPGLWDMHAHYYYNYEESTPLLLANGIVGLREMAGVTAQIKEIRRKIASGEIYGPEIVASGPIIDGSPPLRPNMQQETVTDTATARKVVRRQVAQGADFIKVYSYLSREVYFAVAAEAHKQHVPFAGHIPSSVSFYEAIAAGQKSAEHLFGFLEASTNQPPPPTVRRSYFDIDFLRHLKNNFSRAKYDSLLPIVAASNTWVCPTFVTNQGILNINNPAFRKDERLKYLPAYVIRTWDTETNPRFSKMNEEFVAVSREVHTLQKSLLGSMQQAGVKLLAGTDYYNPYCFPGFSLHDEMQLLVEAGLTPAQALRTATTNPAAYLEKQADYGDIGVGKYASLVLLDANPLTDIRNTQKIAGVFLKGHYFAKPELDQQLALAAKNAARIPIGTWFEKNLKAQGLAKAMGKLDSLIQHKSDTYDYSERALVHFGYKLLDDKQLPASLAVFKMSTVLYPASSNAFDSYAEALMEDGQKALAIQNYEKSLVLDSTNDNAVKMLQKLRAAQ